MLDSTRNNTSSCHRETDAILNKSIPLRANGKLKKKTGLNELVASRDICFLLNMRPKTDLQSRVIVEQICESKMGIGKKLGVDFK